MVGPTVAFISFIATPKLFSTSTIRALLALISSISTKGFLSLSYFFNKSRVGYLYFVNGSFGLMGLLKSISGATVFPLASSSLATFSISNSSSALFEPLFLCSVGSGFLNTSCFRSVVSITVGAALSFPSTLSLPLSFMFSSSLSLSSRGFTMVNLIFCVRYFTGFRALRMTFIVSVLRKTRNIRATTARIPTRPGVPATFSNCCTQNSPCLPPGLNTWSPISGVRNFAIATLLQIIVTASARNHFQRFTL